MLYPLSYGGGIPQDFAGRARQCNVATLASDHSATSARALREAAPRLVSHSFRSAGLVQPEATIP